MHLRPSGPRRGLRIGREPPAELVDRWGLAQPATVSPHVVFRAVEPNRRGWLADPGAGDGAADEEAIIKAARLLATDLLAGRWTPREATAALYRMYVASGYASELADLSGFDDYNDDYYDMLRDGIANGSVAALDEDVMRAARSLAARSSWIPANRPGGSSS